MTSLVVGCAVEDVDMPRRECGVCGVCGAIIIIFILFMMSVDRGGVKHAPLLVTHSHFSLVGVCRPMRSRNSYFFATPEMLATQGAKLTAAV
jgi:uncharacterized membrane protein